MKRTVQHFGEKTYDKSDINLMSVYKVRNFSLEYEVSLAYHKDWKQEETASLLCHLPTPLMLTNKHVLFCLFNLRCFKDSYVLELFLGEQQQGAVTVQLPEVWSSQ